MLLTGLSSVYLGWSTAAGIAGNVFAFVLFLLPIPTFKRIVITKSTEQFSGLPYIYALLNCLICSWYGLPIVKTGIILVATVNSVVAVFQLVYLSMFITYTERAIKLRMMGLIAAVVVVFAFVVFVGLGLLDYDERQTFVGYLSVASLISINWSRSVEFMPFNLSLATFLMSISFSAYGVFKKDPFLYNPNGIGTILGLVQLALYSYYNNVSGDASREPLIVSYA
nr:bidirectional sugar transporter SWEET2a-like [Malus domestica]